MNNVTIVNQYIPDYIVAPGEVLGEYLESAGLTQAQLAERTGLLKKTINEIVKAKCSITAETALRFERVLNRPAHFWSNLERQYQEDRARLSDKIRLEKYADWLGLFPVNEMAKLDWIEKHKEKTKQLDALLRFFAVASPAQWEAVWGDLQVAFRKTKKSKKDMGLVSAWLRQGEIAAQKISCARYDKQKFKEGLKEIRGLTKTAPEVFVPRLQELCATCGVAVVFVPALPKLGIYGATRWYNDKYIMQLSLYLSGNDHLWFTIFHEAAHILKHSRKELFLEGGGLESGEEAEADIFAQNFLIPQERLTSFLDANYGLPTLRQVEEFADDIGIAPGIVVGRLQHDKVLAKKNGNGLKVFFKWKVKQ